MIKKVPCLPPYYQKSYLAIKDVDSLLVNNEDEDNVDNDNENIKEKVHEITNPTDIQTRYS